MSFSLTRRYFFLFFTLLSFGCGGGGGEGLSRTPAPSSPGPTIQEQQRTLVLRHDLLPRALPDTVISLRLLGRNVDEQVVYGPQLFVFQTELRILVPLSSTIIEIEYLDDNGVFGTFRWVPSFDENGIATLNDPAWSNVATTPNPPTETPPVSAPSPQNRILPERLWGADRYLAVTTERPLLAQDVDTRSDIYLRDLLLGSTVKVTESADGPSGEAAVNEDGRWVTFASDATNLVSGDTNNESDIFLWSRLSGATENITLGANGSSTSPTISADGSKVVFLTDSNNLVPGDNDVSTDVLLYDRDDRTLTLVTGALPGDIFSPALNSDGSQVAFVAKVNNFWQVLVYDVGLESIQVLSRDASGNSGLGDSFLPTFGAGQSVLFSSEAVNLPRPSIESGDFHIYRVDGGSPMRVLDNATAPVASYRNTAFTAQRNQELLLIEDQSTTSLGAGQAAAISDSFVALVQGENLLASNPKKSAVVTLNSTYQPVAVQPTLPNFEDLGINNSEKPLVLDFNRDQNPDLIGLASNIGSLRSLILAQSDSSGRFSTANFDLGGSVAAFAKGDFNDDTALDFVTVVQPCLSGFPSSFGPPVLRTYLGDGNGDFSLSHEFSSPLGLWTVAGFFNDDTLPDLLVFSAPDRFDSNGPRSGQVLYGNGDGSFQDSLVIITLPEDGSRPVVGDFNGDGFDDLAVSNALTTQLEIFLNQGDGSFPALPIQRAIPGQVNRFSDLQVIDWDGNNAADLSVGSNSGTEILVSSGDGTFSVGASLSQTGNTFVDELDSVPGPDIYFPSHGEFFSSGSSPAMKVPAGDSIYGSHDFSGDNGLELIMGAGEGVVVLPNLGNGNFGPPAEPLSLERAFVVSGDFTDDILLDLASAVSVVSTQSNGGLSEMSINTPPAFFEFHLMAEDFNNDGYLDQLATENGKIQVSLGDGNGQFSRLAEETLGSEIRAPHVVDFDQDGRVDLVHASSTGILLRAGLGDGSFAAPLTLVSGDFFYLAPPQDYDEDNRVDLIVSGLPSQNSQTSFFKGLGGLQFSTALTSDLGLNNNNLVFDLNNDGFPEIFPHGVTSFAVFVSGCGSFPPIRVGLVYGFHFFATNLTMGLFDKTALIGIVPEFAQISSAVAFDFDLDNQTDLIMLDQYGNLLLAKGNGSELDTISRGFMGRGIQQLFHQDSDYDGTQELLCVGRSGLVRLP